MIESGHEIKTYPTLEVDEMADSFVGSFCTVVKSRDAYFDNSLVSVFLDALNSRCIVIKGKDGVGKSTFVSYMSYLFGMGQVPKAYSDYLFLGLDYRTFFSGVSNDETLVLRIEGIFDELSKSEENVILYMGEMTQFFGGFMVTSHVYQVLENIIENCPNVKMVFTYTSDSNPTISGHEEYILRHCVHMVIPEPNDEALENIGLMYAKKLGERCGVKYKEEDIVKAIRLGCKYLKRRPYGFVRDICRFLDLCFGEVKTLGKKKLLMTHIHNVLSDYADVDAGNINDDEKEWLRGMSKGLSSVVIGQDESIDTLCKVVNRSKMGLRTNVHTVGNFLFVGPTGVGKTLLAKTLTKYLYGREDYLVRFDMSEYMDEISVNKFIGAPPGYVGYGDTSLLCDALENHRDGVLLFDEIEKAHTRVFDVLLQLLDEGRVTDSKGKTYDATGYIIIMTSNIGVKDANGYNGGIGFGSKSSAEIDKARKDIIEKHIKSKFAPEFINRIDKICYFNPLERSEMLKIFDNEYEKLNVLLVEKGYVATLCDEVRDELVDMSMGANMGARPIVRAVEQHIADKISDMMVADELEQTFTLAWDKEKKDVVIKNDT